MPVPSPRNSIRIARGNFADLNANSTAFGEGEFIYAIDQDRFYTSASGALVAVGAGVVAAEGLDTLADVDTSTIAPGVGQVLKWDGTNWVPADDNNTDAVTSVAGKTGDVTLVKADITDFADGDYATAAQGATADSAVQPGDNISTLTNDSAFVDAAGASTAAPVQSVASKTGAVTLVKADITDFSDADYATAAQGATADSAVQRAGDTMTGALGMPVGSAASPSVYFDANTGIYSPGADQLALATNGTGRLFVTSDGKVGVGIASPNFSLTVKGAGSNTAIANFFGATSGRGLVIATNDDGGVGDDTVIYNATQNSGSHVFQIDASEKVRITSTGALNFVGAGTAGSTQAVSFNGSAPVNSLVIDSSGRLGVGTSSPQTLLHLRSNGQPVIHFERVGGPSGYSQLKAGTGFTFSQDSTDIVRITDAGLVGIGTTSPAELLHLQSGSDATLRIDNTGGTARQGRITVTNAGDMEFRARSNNSDGQFIFYGYGGVTDSEHVRIDSSGRLLVGTSSDSQVSTVVFQGSTSGATNNAVLRLCRGESSVADTAALGFIAFGDSGHTTAASIQAVRDGGTWTSGSSQPSRLVFSTTADGASSPTEAMRITNERRILMQKTSVGIFNEGLEFYPGLGLGVTNNQNPVLRINRLGTDGNLVDFYQDTALEGSISVSGTTVSYNGAHLSRWSQLPGGAERTKILRGTVLSNIDEMCAWGEEDNEQLNRMKVSDVEGDRNVAGVFQGWDDDDDTYTDDFYCAMTGDFVIRIAKGVTVERGDLLMSAGDGTAKPQDDDIIRSKTIAKVTSTHVSETYDDGSYCVPCVLMAC